jgi:2-methylisocitrate lyase-like PEP mutase family enzyme
MLPNVPRGRADVEAVAQATHLPLFILRLPPDVVSDAAFLAANKVRVRFLGQAPYAMAVKAIHDGLAHLKEGGAPEELKTRQASVELLRAVDRTGEFKKWQDEFLPR